ncbi:MAG: DsrE family protein [Pseudomonadota bacterium]
MASILVHVTTGPDNPTKAALAFLVAKTALAEGHTVTLFLAGDAVHLFSESALATVEGLGTGSLREHLDAIVATGGQFFLSGMSAKARGYDESLLQDRNAAFAMPDTLVSLLVESDRALTY